MQLADRILVLGEFRLLAEIRNAGLDAPISGPAMRAIAGATRDADIPAERAA